MPAVVRKSRAKSKPDAATLKVLFPLDGSEPAYAAMQKALAMMPMAKATILVVMQDFKGASEDMVKQFEEDEDDEVFPTQDSAWQVFKEIRRRISAEVPQVSFKLAKGRADREILAEAAHHDLLVMHATSRGGLRARGSHRLARHAPCDVLLIRP
jgi:nucleotide-binding universal stress UspA family protein